MEASVQQLVNMGFPHDSAVEALTAADGDVLKATDCLLNSVPQMQPPPPPTPSNHSPPPSVQPKINHFFLNSQNPRKPRQEPDPHQPNKRPKAAVNQESSSKPSARTPPLPERMRPRVVDEVVGQDHLLSRDSLLRAAMSRLQLPSIVLWGPPGTGKTSIAKAIVGSTDPTSSSYRFVSLSAVTCGVKDVRDTVDDARKAVQKANKRTVLFLDEVHRFNKAQQDSFLPVIEDGSIVFIGATTENPSFHLITPLLSRCRVLRLNPLEPRHVATLVRRAIDDVDNGLSSGFENTVKFKASDEAIEFLSLHCDGDARVALNALEVAGTTAIARVKGQETKDESFSVPVDIADVKEALQCKHLAYDRAGDQHYDLISALHKSMRGSDPNASIYWLARMLQGGEEPLYIARRLVRFACEDVGLADPQALTQAVSCYQGCHFIGMPECNVILAQCVAYLALAPKSVAVYRAIKHASEVVKDSVGGNEGVPLHLRNAPTKLMKDFGYGKGYIYPPDNTEELSSSQTYLPPSLQGCKFLQWP